jgi:hypothetical protein
MDLLALLEIGWYVKFAVEMLIRETIKDFTDQTAPALEIRSYVRG